MQHHLPPSLTPMPCQPRNLHFPRYALPNTIGKMESEEAAARILSFSQNLNEWTGVTWLQILEKMKEEYEQERQLFDAGIQERAARENYDQALRKRFWLSILTLGMYALFTANPVEPVRKESKTEIPFSGIYVFGFQHVLMGIQELLHRQLVLVEEKDGVEIIYPTPELVQLALGKK